MCANIAYANVAPWGISLTEMKDLLYLMIMPIRSFGDLFLHAVHTLAKWLSNPPILIFTGIYMALWRSRQGRITLMTLEHCYIVMGTG